MGLLKSIGDFLFGKDPKIFDDQGNVYHEHPKKKWDDWHNRLKYDPNYNWRQHSGSGSGLKNNDKNNEKRAKP